MYKEKPVVIQEFVGGHEAKEFPDKLVKDLAKKIALMNKALLKLKLQGEFIWKKDYQFNTFFMNVKKIGDFKLTKYVKNYFENVKKLDKKKLRRSVIHGDLCEANFLVKNNLLKAFIDFDEWPFL